MNNVRGAIMLDQNLTTFLSVALGGVLAITGGFISNYYIQATARKSEKRRIVREKIDEIYTLSTQVKTSFYLRIWHRSYYTQEQYAKIHLISDEAARELRDIGERMEMLTRLYVSSLTSDILEYRQKIKYIDHRIDDELDPKGRRLEELEKDSIYMNAATSIQNEIESIHQTLQSSLENQIEY
jgi:hypothetical protein